jgi:hypothetical protein
MAARQRMLHDVEEQKRRAAEREREFEETLPRDH